MDTLLSPKQVAQALRVSESSVKRWCDKGSIATTYTDGGHRRIRMGDLAEFIRANKLVVQDFVPMGLAQSSPTVVSAEEAAPLMLEALLKGDEDRCSQLVMEMYLAKVPIYRICDHVIAQAFYKIGDKWACGEADIYQERLGCKVAQRVLHRLQMLLTDPPKGALNALGCASEGDQYCLGSTMAELVLRDAGWRAYSLGENIPMDSLATAIEHHKPKIVWISCSFIADEAVFVDRLNALCDRFHPTGTLFAVGGQALHDQLVKQLKIDLYGRSMQEIFEFAQRVAQQNTQGN